MLNIEWNTSVQLHDVMVESRLFQNFVRSPPSRCIYEIDFLLNCHRIKNADNPVLDPHVKNFYILISAYLIICIF